MERLLQAIVRGILLAKMDGRACQELTKNTSLLMVVQGMGLIDSAFAAHEQLCSTSNHVLS
jgi:hypothetical protein